MSIANVGDVDGSGVNDLLVGSFKDGGYVVPAIQHQVYDKQGQRTAVGWYSSKSCGDHVPSENLRSTSISQDY